MGKRLTAVIFSLIMVSVFTGCAGKRAAPPQTADFSCNAHIVYKDLALEAELSRSDRGLLTVTFTAPATVKGLSMQWDGEKVNLSVGGIGYSLDPAALPESGLGNGLIDVLDTVASADLSPTLAGSDARLTGSGKNGSFTLLSDPITGALRSLSVPSLPLEATFTDFRTTKE